MRTSPLPSALQGLTGRSSESPKPHRTEKDCHADIKGRFIVNGGFVAIFRKIRDNFLWEPSRERTRFEAWIDLTMETQHSFELQPVHLKGRLLYCRRGQSLKSLDTWAKRWGWTKSKVERFFRTLEKNGMITRESEGITTRLSVVNYDIYNPGRNGDVTGTKRTPERYQERCQERKPKRLGDDETSSCEANRNADDTANGTQTGTQTVHRRQDNKRQQGEQCIVDKEKTLEKKPVVDKVRLLREAERFSKKLEEAFAPLDKRNRASFKNLKHDMYEHAINIDLSIFLEGISLICKAQENERIENRQAYVMQAIRNIIVGK